MKDFLQRIQNLPQKKLALLAAQLQSKLEAAQAVQRSPVAIVGIGCRFPGGVEDPESYWRLLSERRDAIRETPRDRWDVDALYDADVNAPGKLATRFGGYLDDIDHFDAQLFGISPREAVSMDPQQRLLLETVWQALERAAIAPGSLSGSRTGVFVGVSTADYFQLQLHDGLESIDGYLASGCAPSVAAGRIAYTLGLQGPTLSVDTACSSSLVAIHLAAQALRQGECDAALAGGVNLILSPVTTIALSKAQMMAPDGRCKAFDARADGFVRGEGCGVLVLKRLDDAIAAGDPIEAVIQGSAINQDGRSNGLTAPNGPAQESVLRQALASAKLEGSQIGYVEAHGTGTSLGDPIEVQALGKILGHERGDRLRIGSVKTNIGHLESAAGVAGLIKAVLAIRHGEIPAHLNLETLSAVIPWGELPVDVPTSATPWDVPAADRFAGVSSFGFSGTNAHVIVGAAPDADRPGEANGTAPRAVTLVALSANSPQAATEVAARHARHVEATEVSAADVGATLNAGRDHFPHRRVLVADDDASLKLDLSALGNGEPVGFAGHVTSHRPPRPVFLFTGQGAQLPRMGADLYATEAVARDLLDRADALLREQFEVPLLEVLFATDDPRLNETGFTQPALFSLEVALAEVWRSWGHHPAGGDGPQRR